MRRSQRRDLLEITPWPYAELAQAWGGVGFRVSSREELREALRAAHQVREFAIIDCRVPPTDISPISRRYIRATASSNAQRRFTTSNRPVPDASETSLAYSPVSSKRI